MITFLAVIGSALALEVGLAQSLPFCRWRHARPDPVVHLHRYAARNLEIFPVGSGFGTYPEVFRRFQPGDVPCVGGFCHNDYLEWLFEGGLPAGSPDARPARLHPALARNLAQGIATGRHTASCVFSAGISLLLIGPSWFHRLQLAHPGKCHFYFAFLAGVFFHSGTKQAEQDSCPPSEKLLPGKEASRAASR